MSVQKTFMLVPTTLRNTTPRPPMTSKEAKKAYREATRLPKMSRAERKRLEVEEIARQKKEYEKEKAASKAKAAKEKKQKKEAEEKAKRKAMGLPEPNRFVRASQPTIKIFVKTGAGGKREWEDVEVKDQDRTHDGVRCQNEHQSDQGAERPAKRSMLKREGRADEDEFGEFPSLSQDDIPSLLGESASTSRSASTKSSPNNPPTLNLEPQLAQSNALHIIPNNAQLKLDAEMNRCLLPTEVRSTRADKSSLLGNNSPTTSRAFSSKPCEGMTKAPAILPTRASGQPFLRSNPKASDKISTKVMADETSNLMPPPAVPMTVNRLGSRMMLRERSINIRSPSRPSKSAAVPFVSKHEKVSEGVARRELSFVPPPSTLAFLEAHIDDFYPSPSQQVRELLEDVHDVPSNTQIAMEIGTTKVINETGPSLPSTSIPGPQSPVEDEEFAFLSSQDLEISSQDLRDIDTPSKPVQRITVSENGKHSYQIDISEELPLPPTPRLKPRFFEEKEDDLLHAALHESLSLAKLMNQGSSPRRSQEVLYGRQLLKSDPAHDDYCYFESDTEEDFLAPLNGV